MGNSASAQGSGRRPVPSRPTALSGNRPVISPARKLHYKPHAKADVHHHGMRAAKPIVPPPDEAIIIPAKDYFTEKAQPPPRVWDTHPPPKTRHARTEPPVDTYATIRPYHIQDFPRGPSTRTSSEAASRSATVSSRATEHGVHIPSRPRASTRGSSSARSPQDYHAAGRSSHDLHQSPQRDAFVAFAQPTPEPTPESAPVRLPRAATDRVRPSKPPVSRNPQYLGRSRSLDETPRTDPVHLPTSIHPQGYVPPPNSPASVPASAADSIPPKHPWQRHGSLSRPPKEGAATVPPMRLPPGLDSPPAPFTKPDEVSIPILVPAPAPKDSSKPPTSGPKRLFRSLSWNSKNKQGSTDSPIGIPGKSDPRFVPGLATSPNGSPTKNTDQPIIPPTPREPIYFFGPEDPYYGFTTFSPHRILYRKKLYPTAEHLFQCHKFFKTNPQLSEHIRIASQLPSDAYLEAQRFGSQKRLDWSEVKLQIMDEVLYLKFTQHQDLRDDLIETFPAMLIGNSSKDPFWGVGPEGHGRNELGEALMRVRARLKREALL